MEKTEKNGAGKKTAEHYLPALKRFYQNLSIYLITNVVLVIVWLLSETLFWPIWVMIGWGVPILFMGYEAGVLPPFIDSLIASLCNSIPFMRKGWVNAKAESMATRANKGRAYANEGTLAATKTSVKSPVAKKKSVPKTTVKKKAPAAVKKVTKKKK